MNRFVLLLSVTAIAAVPVIAYECPVPESAIREAYFLGVANDTHTSEFLAQYTHVMPMPKSGPHVDAITLETPYAQIVEYSNKALNLTAVDAVNRFSRAPANIRLRVKIDLTATYTQIISSDAGGTHLRADDFWKDFTIKLLQGGKEIPAQHVSGMPIHVASDAGTDMLTGATVTSVYSAKDVISDSTTIEVLTPDGQDVRSEFDLNQMQ